MKDVDRKAPPLTEEPVESGGEIYGACVAVPDGEYELRYIDYETAMFFGNPKVILHCAIVEHEEYAGLPVDRFYSVKRFIGQPGRYGNYVAPVRGDLFREFKRVVKEPKRLDRISFESLRGKRLIGEIRTVTWDHQHNPLSNEDQYSRIARLIRVIHGDDW